MTTSLTLISETTDLTTVQNKVILTSVGVAVGPEGPQGAEGAQGIQGIAGLTGLTGDQGNAGTDGLSAYEIAVAEGFVGTEAAWLLSLEGDQGIPGDTGIQGAQGIQGIAGADIDHISLINTAGLVKTYGVWQDSLETISLGAFTVTDGTDGAAGLTYDDTAVLAAIALNTAKVSNVDHPLVETAVPVGAVFTDTNTDTIYDDTAILAAVALNTAKETNIVHPLVETAVPLEAIFTDTVYDDTNTIVEDRAIVAEDNTIDFGGITKNFELTATAATIEATTITSLKEGTIIIHSAENITGWGTPFKFKTVPTDLIGTEIFSYFIEDATNIWIGRVQ